MAKGSWSSKSQNEWNEQAESWHSKSTHMWTKGSRKIIVPTIETHLPTNSTILDVGCGDGIGSLLLSQKGYVVTGMDISEEMIRFAQKNSSNHLSFKVGNMERLQLDKHTYDAVMCINSLEWTENPYSVMHQVNNVLKPGGLVFCAILGPTSGPRSNSFPRLLGEKTICNTMMPWEWKELASKIGWNYIEEKHVYKERVNSLEVDHLPAKLKQSLSFFTLFIFRKQI
ncbi:class I SAM-dependent methyltransferase [Jeotgalibacillus marinus]|uniref:Class I SAM-dependent methyltransferase n=1 Tax=Jeotgalibacillus marinus TaxID=86667 RepID=A0ABV3Q3C0_9BACL